MKIAFFKSYACWNYNSNNKECQELLPDISLKKGKNMQEIDYIFFKIKEKLGVKEDKELAGILDIPYKTINNWRYTKKIPKERILKIAKKIDMSADELVGKNILSNNTNSIVVNGSNSGKLINKHQETKVDDSLMEFIELFKQYGNEALLSKFKDELLKIKKVMEA